VMSPCESLVSPKPSFGSHCTKTPPVGDFVQFIGDQSIYEASLLTIIFQSSSLFALTP
jgi:hypothetical protein